MHMGNIPFILLKGLMMKTELTCPKCGAIVEKYLNPKPTVDIVIHDRERGLVLVDRKNPPYGNALPGGFIDLGESAEQAAVREAFEETNLRVRLTGLLGVYSAPDRDPRQHTISTVFIAEPLNPEQLRAGDDAAKVAFYSMEALPARLGRGENIGEGTLLQKGSLSPPQTPPLSLLRRLSRLSNSCCRLFLSADKKP